MRNETMGLVGLKMILRMGKIVVGKRGRGAVSLLAREETPGDKILSDGDRYELIWKVDAKR